MKVEEEMERKQQPKSTFVFKGSVCVTSLLFGDDESRVSHLVIPSTGLPGYQLIQGVP